MGSKGLLVTFNWTKTIQFGQCKLIIPIVSSPQSVLCPLKAYLHMCAQVPSPKSSVVYVLLVGRPKYQPVTYHDYQNFLHRCISLIHLNTSDYSSHSFRQGGATRAFRSKVLGKLIKVHRDWDSDAYLKYLDFS